MRKCQFKDTANTFSKINMAFLAYCANLVYEPKEVIKAGLESYGFNLGEDNFFISSSETETQCFVAGDDKKIIVSFRGTEGKLADWATNLQVNKEYLKGAKAQGKVHEGFYKGLCSVWAEVDKEIKRLSNNDQTIWFTGHSLGGALATLAAAELKFQDDPYDFQGLYTFGQPRVGDNDFARLFNKFLKKKCFRLVNNNDVVSRVAPRIMGYSHIGMLKYFDADGKLRSDKNLTWWTRFWDSIEGRLEDFFNLTPDGIGDHSMNGYLELTQKSVQ